MSPEESTATPLGLFNRNVAPEGVGSIQACGTLCKCGSCNEKYCVSSNDYRNFS